MLVSATKTCGAHATPKINIYAMPKIDNHPLVPRKPCFDVPYRKNLPFPRRKCFDGEDVRQLMMINDAVGSYTGVHNARPNYFLGKRMAKPCVASIIKL